jgi:predicted RNase H-like HicB family nuclease
MEFTVTIDRDEDGVWIVECPAIPGCVSQGQTKQEAIENIEDVIKLCLEVRAERGIPVTEDGRECVLVEIDDFEREVMLVRQNQELMEFLDQRSEPDQTYTIEEARKILEID